MRFGWLAVPLAVSWALAAAETELDKFRADGETTYCKVTNGLPTTPFASLNPSTAGSCPVAISMTVSVKSYTMLTTVFDVAWSLSMHANRSDDQFPVSVFENTTTFASTVVACSVDSDCATLEDMEEAAAIEDDFPDTVDLESESPITLTTYRLRFSPTGDYVISGVVSISNDDGNMVDIYAFQRARATANLSTPPGTVRPDHAAFTNPTTDTLTLLPSPSQALPKPSVSAIPASTTTQNSTTPLSTQTPDPALDQGGSAPSDTIQQSTTSKQDPEEAEPPSVTSSETTAPLQPEVVVSLPVVPQPNTSVSENAEKGAALSSGHSSSDSMNVIGVASVAAVGLVAAAAYFTAHRERESPQHRAPSTRNSVSL